jgi:hypothetical protein
MQLERIHPDLFRPLEPGRYFVYVDAPVAVLDGMAKAPNAGRTLVSLVFDLSGADVVYLGSGTTWTREGGRLRRVFSVAFEVPEASAARVYYAGAPSALAAQWALAIGLALLAGSITFTVYFVRETLGDVPPGELPGMIDNIRNTVRSFANLTGWLVFGGIAVGGYFVAKRQGWLS